MAFPDIPLRPSCTSYDDLVNIFYAPLLSQAVSYDRVTGYFRSGSLATISSGLAKFLENEQAKMRLIVGSEFSAEDIRAIERGGVLADRLVAQWGRNSPEFLGADMISRQRLEVFAWLLREGRITIKVGIQLDPTTGLPLPRELSTAYFHAKYGVFTDGYGNKVAFEGSHNETPSGISGNFESFSVFPSWKEGWSWNGLDVVRRFEELWAAKPNPYWTVMDLPDAIEDGLISVVKPTRRPAAKDPAERMLAAPQKVAHDAVDVTSEVVEDVEVPREDWEALKDILDAPTIRGGTGVGFATSSVSPWPHQLSTAQRVVGTFPRSYLFADEVGLGKTIEVGLSLRELILLGKVKRALLLTPASVMKQWQEELWEKFSIAVPRLESKRFIWRVGGVDVKEEKVPDGANPWSIHPIFIASSHLARRKDQRNKIKEAPQWDVVVVDEAHHARAKNHGRRNKEPNGMLRLLREMRDTNMWRSVWLASATPMQMHIHEAWDLLNLLGLDGKWAETDQNFIRFYVELAKPFEERDWEFLQSMNADFLSGEGVAPNAQLEKDIKDNKGISAIDGRRITSFDRYGIKERHLGAWADPLLRDSLDHWIAINTPTKERVFRATRVQLRRYQSEGILDATIPTREIRNVYVEMTEKERELYDRIELYIIKNYNKYMADKRRQSLGFIMTIFRRRLTSSFEAIKKSLERRRAKLLDVNVKLFDDDDTNILVEDDGIDNFAEIDSMFQLDEESLAIELDQLDSFIREIEQLPEESKLKNLAEEIDGAFASGQRTVVIFTQYTDSMRSIANRLAQIYGTQVACWSGSGGERYNPDMEDGTNWEPIDKPQLKKLFREGNEIKILVGTDSMSEGLNLQTCGFLVNYDLPWNVMRVEQRIGRVDRIGGKEIVVVTNYTYENTIEEQIIRRINDDHQLFQEIIGDAQPVVESLEKTIKELAMTAVDERQQKLEEALEATNQELQDIKQAPLKLSEIGEQTFAEVGIEPAITLEQIEQTLLSSSLTQSWFINNPVGPPSSLIYIENPNKLHQVTFHPSIADENKNVRLLTYLDPVLEQILERIREALKINEERHTSALSLTETTGTLPAKKKKKVVKSHSKIKMTDILASGLITAGTEVYSTNGNWPGVAIIQADGALLADGKDFATPSAAGQHTAGGLATNGWTFWATRDNDGNRKTLAEYRDECEQRHQEDDQEH